MPGHPRLRLATTSASPPRGPCLAGTLLGAALVLSGCAADGAGRGTPDGTPSVATLQQTARSAVSGKGQVDVRLVDGVAIVTGEVENAIDENAIVRALRRLDGVERVEVQLRREM